MDRNLNYARKGLLYRVAPREGSVDRNRTLCRIQQIQTPSLPARGAWIEIDVRRAARMYIIVAPREGSVDRNTRRLKSIKRALKVAPREGSVDRNWMGARR